MRPKVGQPCYGTFVARMADAAEAGQGGPKESREDVAALALAAGARVSAKGLSKVPKIRWRQEAVWAAVRRLLSS